MDRKICQSFKTTCKASPAAHTKKRHIPVEAKRTPKANSSVAKIETPRAESKIVSRLIPETPSIKPKEITLVPLPRIKPQKLASVILPPPVAGRPSIKLHNDEPSSEIDKDCLQQLYAQGAGFTVATGVMDSVATGVADTVATSGNAVCHVQNPVRLKYVKWKNDLIQLPEAPLLNCKYAVQFSKWLSESAAPILAAQLNTSLEKVSTGPGYDCRGRNGDMFAKISEHGRGNAVDISTFSMHDGKVINVADAQTPSASSYTILRGLRSSACGNFTTVLGPGSNSAHASHFHLDLGTHGNSSTYRICE